MVRCRALTALSTPAHDEAGVEVDAHREVEPPGEREQLGGIAHPALVGCARGEITPEQIGRHR